MGSFLRHVFTFLLVYHGLLKFDRPESQFCCCPGLSSQVGYPRIARALRSGGRQRVGGLDKPRVGACVAWRFDLDWFVSLRKGDVLTTVLTCRMNLKCRSASTPNTDFGSEISTSGLLLRCASRLLISPPFQQNSKASCKKLQGMSWTPNDFLPSTRADARSLFKSGHLGLTCYRSSRVMVIVYGWWGKTVHKKKTALWIGCNMLPPKRA